MKTTKHFALMSVFVFGATLFASTPARAQSTITLTNVADPADPDSDAAGEATLTNVIDSSDAYGEWNGDYFFVYHVYSGDLTVRCSGLTPGATYSIGPTGFQGNNFQPTYSSVKASDTGTVELAVPVSFVGEAELWHVLRWRKGKPLFWEYVDSSQLGYSFSVARKQGNGYIEVLHGY
jgi:hypothetical protein